MKTRIRNQRGEIVGGVLWAIAVVVLLGALAQLLGLNSVGLLDDAINWCTDRLRALFGGK